jgi:hypothetical protein
MRFVVAGLILMLGAPASDAAGAKSQCKNICDTQYRFCLSRSLTKQARNSCKVTRRTCKGQCR